METYPGYVIFFVMFFLTVKHSFYIWDATNKCNISLNCQIMYVFNLGFGYGVHFKILKSIYFLLHFYILFVRWQYQLEFYIFIVQKQHEF